MRILGQLVVGNSQGLQLRRRQMMQLNGRDFCHPQLLRSENATMTNDDLTTIVDHNRCNKAELPDGVRYLADLLLRVLPRIPRIEDQFLQIPILNVYFD